MVGSNFEVDIIGKITGFDASSINGAVNALKTVPPAGQAAGTAVQGVGTAFTGVTGPVSQSVTGFVGASNGLGTLGGSATKTVGAFGPLGSAFQQTTQATAGVAQGGLYASNGLHSLGLSSQKTAASMGSTIFAAQRRRLCLFFGSRKDIIKISVNTTLICKKTTILVEMR